MNFSFLVIFIKIQLQCEKVLCQQSLGKLSNIGTKNQIDGIKMLFLEKMQRPQDYFFHSVQLQKHAVQLPKKLRSSKAETYLQHSAIQIPEEKTQLKDSRNHSCLRDSFKHFFMTVTISSVNRGTASTYTVFIRFSVY